MENEKVVDKDHGCDLIEVPAEVPVEPVAVPVPEPVTGATDITDEDPGVRAYRRKRDLHEKVRNYAKFRKEREALQGKISDLYADLEESFVELKIVGQFLVYGDYSFDDKLLVDVTDEGHFSVEVIKELGAS